MPSLPVGLIVMGGVLAYALGGVRLATFMNAHSIVLVIVGTVGVLALSTPLADIVGLIRNVLLMRKSDTPFLAVNTALIELSKKRDASVKGAHPLIGFAQDLWEQGVEPQLFTVLMGQKLEEINGMTESSVATLRNLAKYPPALGMTGTVIGLVSLFGNLTPDNRESIGPNLALAMTATFYGLLLANVLLMPLADRLHVMHVGKQKVNEHVYSTLMLINDGQPTSIIEEELKSAA